MVTVSTIDLSQLILMVLGTIVLGAIAAAGTAARTWLQSRTTAQQIANIGSIVRWAVLAVEQTGVALSAAQKKDEALERAVAWLEANGVKVNRQTLDLLDTAIEAAVKLEFHKTFPAPEPPPPEPAS